MEYRLARRLFIARASRNGTGNFWKENCRTVDVNSVPEVLRHPLERFLMVDICINISGYPDTRINYEHTKVLDAVP